MKSKLIAAEPVSAYDAKTHLPKLLERAQQGESFVITRHGKPVARLIPIDRSDDEAVAIALDRVRAIRARLARQRVSLASVLGEGESARQLTHGGHRY